MREEKEEGGRGRLEEVLAFLFSVIFQSKVYRRFVACCENRLFPSLLTFLFFLARKHREQEENGETSIKPYYLVPFTTHRAILPSANANET